MYNVYTVLYILTFKEFKNGEKKKIERESKTTGQCSMADWWGPLSLISVLAPLTVISSLVFLRLSKHVPAHPPPPPSKPDGCEIQELNCV